MANSDYFRDLMIQRTFLDGGAAFLVALHTDDPGVSGEDEVPDVQRQPVRFQAAGVGTVTNANALQFEDMPEATVRFFSVWDSEGRYLTGGPLDIGLIVPKGTPVRWRQGELTLKIP